MFTDFVSELYEREGDGGRVYLELLSNVNIKLADRREARRLVLFKSTLALQLRPQAYSVKLDFGQVLVRTHSWAPLRVPEALPLS